MARRLDRLDLTVLRLLTDQPRASVLELARLAGVARATISARLDKLQTSGVVAGFGPDVDLDAAGFPVHAMVTLEIAQGRLADITELLTSLPGVLEAYATTGPGDVVCRIAAASNEGLQELLLALNRSDAVRRSTSVLILSTVVGRRFLPLLDAAQS